MADIRNPVSATSPATQRVVALRSEAVRTAQRAFFEAALTGSTAVASDAPKLAPVAPSRPIVAEAAAPGRMLRPGSLLDIKV